MESELTEGTKLRVSWDSIIPMREMEQELKVLFARYGLEFFAGGSDLLEYSRELVFEVPVKEVQHVVIRWSGMVHIGLEREFGELLRAYGYTCTAESRAADDEDMELVFQQPV